MIKSSTVSSLPTESDEIHGCSLKCDLLKLFGANTHINFKVLSWLRRAAAVPVALLRDVLTRKMKRRKQIRRRKEGRCMHPDF
jgi:Mg2+/Co2+ transporter CorC